MESPLTSANEYYLNNVVKLTHSHQVTAAEDIYDSKGTKLWAKGADITPALREKLIRHKLRKPVESALTVADGVSMEMVLAEAQALHDELPALRVFMGSKQSAVFDALAQINLHPVVVMLLTMSRQNHTDAFRHGVLAALISASLGVHRGASHSERMLLALAGLLHDVGEMYINPDYVHTRRQLRPEEWKHVAVHPHIGQLILEELTDYPKAVVTAVGEHHERLDGSGYPRQLSGRQISPAGQILSIAEMLSGIIVGKDDVLARSCLALKCVPGEHPRELVSVVSSLRSQHADAAVSSSIAPVSNEQTVLKTHGVSQAMTLALAECDRIEPDLAASTIGKDLLQRVKKRLTELQTAMKATGVEECLDGAQLDAANRADYEILLELDVVGREIGWRLRDIARSMYLHLSELEPQAATAFSALVELLDNPAKS